MTDQSYAAQVAADVAARYGLPVAATVVQLVPRGVSSAPLPVWDGSQLVYAEDSRISWRNQRLASYRNRNVSPKAIDRRLQVAALHAEGLHDAAIAAQLGVFQSVVASDRKRLQLLANPSRTSEISRDERNARIRAYIAQGWGPEAIAAEIGVAASTVRDVARHMLNMPFATAPKVKAVPKIKAPRLAKVRLERPARVRVPNIKQPAQPSPSQKRLAAMREMIESLGRDLTRADLNAYSVAIGRTILQLRRDVETLGVAWPRPPNWHTMATIRLSPIERRAVRDKRRADMAAMDLAQMTVAQLVQQFAVSKETISRDLAALGRCTMMPARGLRGVIKDAFDSHQAKVADLHSKGADRAEIQRGTGLSRNALARHLKTLGLDLPRGYVNPWANRERPGVTDRVKELLAQIAVLRNEGKTYSEIMAATGLRKASVSRYLMQLGLTGRQATQPGQVAA